MAAPGVVDDHAGSDAAETIVDGALQGVLVEPLVRGRQPELERQLDLAARAAGAERQDQRQTGAPPGVTKEAHAALFTPFCSSSSTTLGA